MVSAVKYDSYRQRLYAASGVIESMSVCRTGRKGRLVRESRLMRKTNPGKSVFKTRHTLIAWSGPLSSPPISPFHTSQLALSSQRLPPSAPTTVGTNTGHRGECGPVPPEHRIDAHTPPSPLPKMIALLTCHGAGWPRQTSSHPWPSAHPSS